MDRFYCTVSLIFYLYVIKVFIFHRESSNSSLYGEGNVTIESHVQELYIELMCEKQPEDVYTYVRSSEGYRLEETLEVHGPTVLLILTARIDFKRQILTSTDVRI